MDWSWWVAIGASALCIGIMFFFEVRFYRKYPNPKEREEKLIQFLDKITKPKPNHPGRYIP